MSRPRSEGRLAALLVVLLSAAFGVVLLPSAPAYAAASPRIMVVGDSISQGMEGDFTWRYRLWEHLTQDGLTPQFVGPWTGTTHAGPYTGVSGDPFHDGAYRPGISFPQPANLAEWGWMMAEAKTVINQQVKTYQPDYLLVELGFNDIAWNLGTTPPDEIAAGVISSMKTLVTNARLANPNIKILLADVPHRGPIENYPELPGKLDAYDSRIGAAIAEVNAAEPGNPPVVRVNFDANYHYATDTYDGLHPNVRGEYVIAQQFAAKLAALGVGTTMSVPGSTPADLRPGPTGTITARVNSDWSADLSWPHVFGAGGFWIWVRDRTAGETGFHKLPFPVGSDGWKAAQLAAGHQIDFKVETARGDWTSVFSPTTTVTGPPLPAVHFTVTPGKYSATIKWDPVPGADDYHIYAGGNCADQIPGVDDNMQMVQWSLGDKTSFTQTYITGVCMNYYVVASKYGGEGARPAFATRVWPSQDNVNYTVAQQHYFSDAPAAGDKVLRTTVGAGTDRGILVMRGFIADNSNFDALIGDHRQWSESVAPSAKATIVWNTRTGAVAVYIHKSCLFGDNGWQCKDAAPIALVSDAYHVPDGSTDYRNLMTVAKNSDGGLSVGVSAVNSWSPVMRAAGAASCAVQVAAIAPVALSAADACFDLINLGRISDQITATPSGSTFSISMTGDKYPSWEFYRYVPEGPLGSTGLAKLIGTRAQTVVTDLRGAQVTCRSAAGEIDTDVARPMTCS